MESSSIAILHGPMRGQETAARVRLIHSGAEADWCGDAYLAIEISQGLTLFEPALAIHGVHSVTLFSCNPTNRRIAHVLRRAGVRVLLRVRDPMDGDSHAFD